MSQSQIAARGEAPAGKPPAGKATVKPGGAAPARGRAAVRRASLSRLLRPILMIGGIAIVLVGGLIFWVTGGRYITSEDTYVDADKVSLSTDVSGLISAVYVKDNQHVEAGQPLFALDPRAFSIAVEQAQSQLAQAKLDIAAAKRNYREALDQIKVQQSAVADDESNLTRYGSVVKSGGVTQATYEDQRYKVQADQARLEQLQDDAGVQLTKLEGDADIQPDQTPEVRQAAAQLANAEREQTDSLVKAPFSGTVTLVPQLQPGMMLLAGSAAFGLVSDTDVWITSQPKESDLTWVRPGQPVAITIDAYPGQKWQGVVESISPASGSEFSILPAQNSSGNWVKVVQRVPVRVKITQSPSGFPLRAGMSAEISIDTGHKRHLRDLF